MEKWLAPDQNGDVNIDKELAMDWKNKIKEIDFKLYVWFGLNMVKKVVFNITLIR